MASRQSLLVATLISGLLQRAEAQANITADRCVDPSAYTSCNNDVTNQVNSCTAACNGSGSCIFNCHCISHQNYVNCIASTCWNQVFSCEYQQLIVQYFNVCPTACDPIPFWPAPTDAPAACSCNLGRVSDYIRKVVDEQVSCFTDMTGSISISWTDGLDIAKKASRCACCGASASYSATHAICPNTIPTLAGSDLWLLPNTWLDFLPNWAWASCGGTLDSYNCRDLGFSKPPGQATFYTPDDMPDDGMQSLSNGDGTVTVPPSGTVFTWHQSATTYTVSARAYQGGSGHGDGTATGIETLAGTGDGPVQTVGQSLAGREKVSLALVGVGTMLGVLFI